MGLLQHYRIPIPKGGVAKSAQEAFAVAESLGRRYCCCSVAAKRLSLMPMLLLLF